MFIYRKPLEADPYTEREISVLAHGVKPEKFIFSEMAAYTDNGKFRVWREIR
jgi:hypothetical protein